MCLDGVCTYIYLSFEFEHLGVFEDINHCRVNTSPYPIERDGFVERSTIHANN